MAKKIGKVAEEPPENRLWEATDKLKQNIDAAENKQIDPLVSGIHLTLGTIAGLIVIRLFVAF